MSFNNFENELGKLIPKKPTQLLRLKAVKKSNTFANRISTVGESKNVVDLREKPDGTNSFEVRGYFTYYTWYHLQINVAASVENALRKQGFNVLGVNIIDRDWRNSQYYFEIFLKVLPQYDKKQVARSIYDVLNQTVALPNSVRFSQIYVRKSGS